MRRRYKVGDYVKVPPIIFLSTLGVVGRIGEVIATRDYGEEVTVRGIYYDGSVQTDGAAWFDPATREEWDYQCMMDLLFS
jgi:hypothetical protein